MASSLLEWDRKNRGRKFGSDLESKGSQNWERDDFKKKSSNEITTETKSAKRNGSLDDFLNPDYASNQSTSVDNLSNDLAIKLCILQWKIKNGMISSTKI